MVYDPESDSWDDTLAVVPTLRDYAHSVTALDGKIYVTGGWGEGGSPALDAHEMYDPVTDTWTAKAPALVASASAVQCALGGKLYRFGVAGTEIYDPVADAWVYGEAPPVIVANAAAVELDDRIYYFTWTGNSVYDPAADTGPGGNAAWSGIAAMPVALGDFAAVLFQGKIHCLGGNSLGGDVALNQVFDPVSGTWSEGMPMDIPRMRFAAEADEHFIYVVGGNDGSEASRKVSRYDPGSVNYLHVKE